jgi:hypothetical protein
MREAARMARADRYDVFMGQLVQGLGWYIDVWYYLSHRDKHTIFCGDNG